VLSDFVTFQRQISAGLNYAISGMPYWTTDIGGFISGGDLKDPKFRELFVRWYQFGAFSPIFRVHGTRNPERERAMVVRPRCSKILVDYDTLRYRLDALHLLRSLARDQRALHHHASAGHGLAHRCARAEYRRRVSLRPVHPGESRLHRRARPAAKVYLPQGHLVRLLDRREARGRQTIQAAAPLEKLPLYVRAGSIMPIGPTMEWTTEKPEDPIELRIYPGANGDFTLYEDENDNYNYEKGIHAAIPMHWDDAARDTDHRRPRRHFPRHAREHTFRIVIVSKSHGAGIEESLTGSHDKSTKAPK
jgi:alpha-D-xyloside xylohydrolase